MTEIIGKMLELDKPMGKPEKDGRGPECFFIIEMNRQTKKIFDKGNNPHQGARYVFKCLRFDGKKCYLGLEQL